MAPTDKLYDTTTDDNRVNHYIQKSIYKRVGSLPRVNDYEEKAALFRQKMAEIMLPERLLQLRQARWSAEYYATVAAENNPEEKIYAIAMLIFS